MLRPSCVICLVFFSLPSQHAQALIVLPTWNWSNIICMAIWLTAPGLWVTLSSAPGLSMGQCKWQSPIMEMYAIDSMFGPFRSSSVQVILWIDESKTKVLMVMRLCTCSIDQRCYATCTAFSVYSWRLPHSCFLSWCSVMVFHRGSRVNRSDLDMLLSVVEVTGCVRLNQPSITNASFLRNVRTIGKCVGSYSSPTYSLMVSEVIVFQSGSGCS